MAARWKRMLNQGLGDRKTRVLGCLLIAIGILGTLLLQRFANFETVFVATFLAGSALGRWWTYLVPFSVMAVVEPIAWGSADVVYTSNVVLGLTFFIVTGYVFVAFVGRRVRRRVLFRVGSLALITTLSVPLTIAYDLWTDVGQYYFIARPLGQTFWQVLLMQVPFTVYHVLSSLLFVPLFGAGILWLNSVGWPTYKEEPAPSEPHDSE